MLPPAHLVYPRFAYGEDGAAMVRRTRCHPTERALESRDEAPP